MEDHKRKSSKKKICFITLFIVLIAVVGIFVFLSFKGESIKAQVDRLLHTNQVEVIFLQRDNDPVSSTVKDVLDHDLKEQGITYTTINVTMLHQKKWIMSMKNSAFLMVIVLCIWKY